jgi:hypothetical protein
LETAFLEKAHRGFCVDALFSVLAASALCNSGGPGRVLLALAGKGSRGFGFEFEFGKGQGKKKERKNGSKK